MKDLSNGDDIYLSGEINNRMRQIWTDKWDFILTAAGLTLGLNNIWRFPYFCYANDGGSFFFAYTIIMIFCGLPLLCMEYAIGQLAQQGQAAFANFCPLLKGFVVTSLSACVFIIPIYTTLNCWSCYYFIKSLFDLPIWSKCEFAWNSRHCLVKGVYPNATQLLLKRYKNYFLSKNLNPAYFLTNNGLRNLTSLSLLLVNENKVLNDKNLNPGIFNELSSNPTNTLQDLTKSTIVLDSFHKNPTLFSILASGNFSQLQNLPLLNNLPPNYPNMKNLNNLTYLINFASNLTSSPVEVENKNKFIYNTSYYATQEFFDFKLNGLNKSWNTLGFIKWEYAIPSFVIWITIFICLRKHLTFSRHSTNCLAIIPLIFIFILVIRALMLPGAEIGISYLFKPTWEGLSKPKVWLYATGLCFHSIGAILGTSLSMAKCNKRNNNFFKDAVLVCFLNFLSLIIIGSIVFSTLGYLAQERNLPLSKVILNDPSVAFVTFCEFMMTLPFPTLWAGGFFLLLFFVGTDYQIAFAATLLTTMEDMWGYLIRKYFFSHQLFILLVCLVFMVFNSLFLTQKGILLILSVDTYVTVWLTVILALIEVVIVGWFYGGSNFVDMIKQKASKQLGFFVPFCWNILTPLILIVILSLNIYSFEYLKFRQVENNLFLKSGIYIAIFSLLFIPIYAYLAISQIKVKTSLINKFMIACQSNFTAFPDNEILFNDKYLTNYDTNFDFSSAFNASPSILPFQPKLSTVVSEDMNDFAKRNNSLENKLIEQSKLTFSVLNNLDKETTI